MDNILNNSGFDSVFGEFDDEIDCAIIGDEEMVESLTGEADLTEDDLVDTTIDYSNEEHNPDIVDMDADDMIAVERDIAYDPFGDEDIIDAATDGDDIVDIDDDDI